MSHRYKVGDKVRIIWDRTDYFVNQNYMNTGEVKSYFITENGIPLLELYNFYKRDKYHSLHFPVDAVHPLVEVVKDGDTL